MTFTSITDALEAADPAKQLQLDCGELDHIPDEIGELRALHTLQLDNVHADLSFPDSLAQLDALRSLAMTGPEDCSARFPAVFSETPVTNLHVRHFRTNDLAEMGDQLRRLRLTSYFIYQDMEPLFSELVGLEYLEIWGFFARDHNREKAQLVLPASIANLEKLEELEIVSAGLRTLPDAIADLHELQTVRLRNHPFEAFPAVLTRVPNLVDLEFAQMSHISDYPDDIADMTALRRLDLSGSWNGGALPSSWDDVEYDPLPSVLGELDGLLTLLLDGCAVPDLTPLASLTGLETLSVDWGAFDDLSPLAEIGSLKSLSIQHAWVEDLGPLAALENLETLDIRNAKVDDQAPSALEPLEDLPNLEEVLSDQMTVQEWRELRAQPAVDPDEIVDRLGSNAIEDVRSALDDIIAYSEARSTSDSNALLTLFNLEAGPSYAPGVIEFAPLDDAVERFATELPADQLARLAGATFTSTSDGWKATLTALRELVSRDALDAQLRFVDAWFEATKYYDGGHRHWEDTVHDQLIDDIWADFDPRAIAELLVDTSEDELDSEFGDGMDELFSPALSGLDELHPRLMETVREYAFRNIDDVYGTSPSVTLEMLESTIDDAVPAIAAELRSITEEMRAQMNDRDSD